MKFVCINVFRDKSRDCYATPGEVVNVEGEAEISRLIAANCIRPMPEGPRQAAPASPPQREMPQGAENGPVVETAAVEVPERQARVGRPRGRKRKA